MSIVVVVARLTIKEASRRRLLVALAGISLVMVGLSAWGFDRLSHSSNVLSSGESRFATATALILFMFMFSLVISLSAVVIASPSISGEVDSGVAQAVLVRPVRRGQILLGKWLGMAIVVAAYAMVVGGLEVLVVWAVSGYAPLLNDTLAEHRPGPVAAIAYLIFQGILVLTLTLALSTVLAPMAAGAVAVALFGAAWLAGVVGTLGASLNIHSLQTAGRIAKVVLPTDGLWHAAIWYLEPVSLLGRALGQDGNRPITPFQATGGPPIIYVLWAVLWVLLVFAIAARVFARAEP